MRTILFLILSATLLFGQEPPTTMPDPAAQLNEEGVAHFNAGRYDDAIHAFRKAIDRQKLDGKVPVDETIRSNLMQALLAVAGQKIDEGEFGLAERALDEAKAQDPKSASVMAYFGFLNLRQGYYDRALSFENDAILLDKNSSIAYEYRGHVHYRLEDLELAIADWKKAMELAPKKTAHLRDQIKKAEKELAVESGMSVEKTTHFVCKFSEDTSKDVAATILKWVEDAYSEIGAKFRFYPGGNLTIVLYSNQSFSAATDTHSWASGLYDGKIRVPVKNFDATRDQMRQTLFHEYTHFVIANFTRQCPAWLNEGLAQVEEGRKGADAIALLKAAKASDKLKSFAQMGLTFAGIANPREAELCYVQALAFTEYLIRETSFDRLVEFIQALKPKTKMLEAFDAVFGKSLAEYEASWRETL